MSKTQCRNCLNRVDVSNVFHVMRSVGGSAFRASGRRKSTICVACARGIVETQTQGHSTRNGWEVRTLERELVSYDKARPVLPEVVKQEEAPRADFAVLQSALKAFRIGDRLNDDELRVLAKRFRDAAVALSGIMEYDIARRSATHDWHRIHDVAKARGVVVERLHNIID